MKLRLVIGCRLTLLVLLIMGTPAWAEWKVEGEGNVFYTDDVALFSASQRLSLQEDPTQPVIDTTDQGDDVVFEPAISLGRSFQPSWGDVELTVRAQGYVFADHSEFNHGTYGAQITQALPAETLLRLRYHYGPNLFVGKNREKRTGNELLVEERVTTHFGTAELEHDVRETLMVRLLGRYGHRSYNQVFKQRDTNFWTVGTHAIWEIIPGVELVLGYHYERTLADGRKRPELEDDISSFIHYVVAELEVEVTEKTAVKLAFDFERTNYTTGIPDDERRDGSENIYQGEIEVRHAIHENIDLLVAYLRGQRKFSFEDRQAIINTVWIGSAFRF
ncbi:MAG: hypothetical protein NPIRA02_20650 [Nitrospirales bacterium]|nr:MAG: hypothetical protein NPIRA02_20650 [Nitrospirales bacterium]